MKLYKKIYFNVSALILITFTSNSVTKYHLSFEQQLKNKCPELTIISSEKIQKRNVPTKEKEWSFIVYMAADNDLSTFAIRNLKQMVSIGSNQHLNILIHLDIRLGNNQKTTRRYFVEKNKLIHTNENDPFTQQMDSGDPRTLISCCQWAITNYPATNYALIFWNHGLGAIDPARGKVINPSQLFTFNPFINKFELDRSIGFLDLLSRFDEEQRGICWDDSTGNYLTNQKLDAALKEIYETYLNGKKFSIVGFDACLMSMIEIANIVKPYAEFMVSSQEVELGTGWNYKLVLESMQTNPINKLEFAQHIVEAYSNAYESITNDFTQSALDLKYIDKIEVNVNKVAEILIRCLNIQKRNSVTKGVKISANKLLCTHFEEPSFKDLSHFYINLLNNIKHFTFINTAEGKRLTEKLEQTLQRGREYIHNAVVANRVGKNLINAKGLSIYLPEKRIHPSYRKTTFAQTNKWIEFLIKYISL